MTKRFDIRPEYVNRIPPVLDNGVIYISLKYSTAAHNCCCGCDTKIVTPLKPGKWRLETRGDVVSIYPSIGNWSAACQSHYWIADNRVEWARRYSPAEIAQNRRSDHQARRKAHAERLVSEGSIWGRLWVRIRNLWAMLSRWF